MSVASRFRELLPADAIVTGGAAHAFAVDGLTPQGVLFPETVEELSRCMAAADDAALAVMPVGNGTQLGFGNRPQQYDVALATRRLRRILAHEAADMTVTVEAGATVAEVNAALQQADQHLPLDPLQPEHTTIGALIATDASGPLRLSQGKVRDLLIGIKVVLADGTLVKGGGRVVKNVAGYDLMKLFTGSFGTLGVIVEATFKVRPRPEREAVLVVTAPDTRAAMRLALEVFAAPVTPLYLEVLNRAAAAAVGLGDVAAMVIGCGGNAEEIDIQRARVREVAGTQTVRTCDADEAVRLYATLRDFPATNSLVLAVRGFSPNRPFETPSREDGSSGRTEGLSFGSDDGTARAEEAPSSQAPSRSPSCASSEGIGCKVSLLPSRLPEVLVRIEEETARRNFQCAILSHVGSGIASLRFSGADAACVPLAEWINTTARQAQGWAIFDLLPAGLKARIDTWGTDVPALSLMRGIKRALDPHNRLSPGRFVGGI